ncbi:hypothetical protein OUY22_18560 [Nonomuraea sp. MCN248]|uniref:DUF3558 domain-containing protein n=1 Tax=Nonomuraea corallina TaxID=2989783 RepID=A0ABT4SE08_9ACTN|nr:hypothetical protein [Nonomuraea corallina]MDA0635429.1 hypothetical protein [Nonomuraea corallina]
MGPQGPSGGNGPFGGPPGPSGRPRRRGWLLPTLAAGAVVLVGGGAGGYLVYGQLAGDTGPTVPVQRQTGPDASTGTEPAAGPDACAMLPPEEAERLVPGATVVKGSREHDTAVTFTCNLVNQRISYGEFWRNREIDIKVNQHFGDGAKTGRTMAQTSYEFEYGSAKYRETAKPTPSKGEKEYVSPVKDIPGVGDGAYAQYTWRRSGEMLWYSYGQAFARVHDMTIEVKYQAGQQRKDAQVLSSKTTQSITEENAIREVTGLVEHVAKGVADWKARNPNVVAQPYPTTTSTPDATPTPSPTQLRIFPAACESITPDATELVPRPVTRARGVEVGNDTQTECRWLNLDVPGVAGKTRVRSVLITVHSFTNRAGVADKTAAGSFYATRRGQSNGTEHSTIGGITFGAVRDIRGVGESAHGSYVQTRQGEVHAGSASVMARQGSLVVIVDYAGAERPKGKPADAPEVEMLREKEARDGALKMARAFLAALVEKPIGS